MARQVRHRARFETERHSAKFADGAHTTFSTATGDILLINSADCLLINGSGDKLEIN